MAHVRKQIRDAAAVLVTGLTTTGTNVFVSRVYPVDAANLPCLLVYTISETVEPENMGSPRTYGRDLKLAVEGIAQANSNLDDTLDLIGSEVETALGADLTITATAKSITLEGVEIGLSEVGEKPAGSIRMTFGVYYRTAENAPDILA